MDNYETEISRQPSGPFSNRKERQTIRRVAEHWLEGQRYSEERKRRLQGYGWWVGFGVPLIVSAWKLFELFTTGK